LARLFLADTRSEEGQATGVEGDGFCHQEFQVTTMRAGNWVEVCSKEEILATLDRDGRLEGLPFMPEMLRFCGKRFQVHKRAYKSCDTVSGRYSGLRIDRCVHLKNRCDGAYHASCQAGCLLFWKEAWLKPLAETQKANVNNKGRAVPRLTEADLLSATRTQRAGDTVYSCQATALLDYSSSLKWWDARQYVEAYSSGNRSAGEVLKGLVYLFYYYGLCKPPRLGAPWRWLYDRLRPLWRGSPFPRRMGSLPHGEKAPAIDLALQPGEFVRVKPYKEILATLDDKFSNRGLAFDAELVPFCGHTYRVQRQVEQFVDERTGKIRRLKTPAVILDGVVCQSRFCGQRMFCPREIYLWWREIWLERVEETQWPGGTSRKRCPEMNTPNEMTVTSLAAEDIHVANSKHRLFRSGSPIRHIFKYGPDR
jgi:hypothetical protein